MGGSSRDVRSFDGWTRRRFGIAAGGGLTTLLGLTTHHGAAAQGKNHGHGHGRVKANQHAKAQLQPVNGSSVSGFVSLQQRKKGQGTSIEVHATGLTPGVSYVSLYYSNPTCELEPYSPQDQIGPSYAPNPAGNGQTHGQADDDLDEIHSVSVRRASDFALQACATIS